MPTKRQTRSSSYWPLTKAACKAAKIPHQRRHIIREGRGDSMICDLCGATLEKAGRAKRKVA